MIVWLSDRINKFSAKDLSAEFHKIELATNDIETKRSQVHDLSLLVADLSEAMIGSTYLHPDTDIRHLEQLLEKIRRT